MRRPSKTTCIVRSSSFRVSRQACPSGPWMLHSGCDSGLPVVVSNNHGLNPFALVKIGLGETICQRPFTQPHLRSLALLDMPDENLRSPVAYSARSFVTKPCRLNGGHQTREAVSRSRGEQQRERGCVRRTSRSRAEREEAGNSSNALRSAMALRLGVHPQSRPEFWSRAGARGCGQKAFPPPAVPDFVRLNPRPSLQNW